MDLMFGNTYIGTYRKGRIEILSNSLEAELYFGVLRVVDGQELSEFIRDRIISKDRRDIDKFLSSIGLNHYDAHEIALITRLVNPMDQFWLRKDSSETYENFVKPKLEELFKYNKIGQANTMSSGGQNIKYYREYNGDFGVVKKRLTGLTYDTESELAVYQLSKLLRVETCPVYRVDNDHTFSVFLYNFWGDSIIHMRHALKKRDPSKDTYTQIIESFPKIKNDVIRMLILDFVTAQDDRHMSNYALFNGELYPLYDNGRSLFWENRVEDIHEALKDVKMYSTSFGDIGSYYDVLYDISQEGILFSDLVNLNIPYRDIYEAYETAEYKDRERLTLISKWTSYCLKELKHLDNLTKVRLSSNSGTSLLNKKSNLFGQGKED